MSWHCTRAFKYAEVAPNGAVYLCCSGWVDVPVGNVHRDSLLKIWNGEAAQRFRESIHDGSFRHCVSCPYMTGAPVGPLMARSQVKDERHRRWIANGTTVIDELSNLTLAYDRSCNLSCPSCRNEVTVVAGGALKYLQMVQAAVLQGNTLGKIRRLQFSGGEPFASKTYRDLIRRIDPEQYPDLSISLQTNGLLFEIDAWLALGPARGIVHCVAISIDAATPETYALNRRGGDWWKLQQRLEFIGRLRREGPIRELRFCFVVQANNFREMPAFMEFARRHDADTVFFTPLRNWGAYEDEEFRQRAVSRLEHPRHQEYRRLAQNISPVVKLSESGR